MLRDQGEPLAEADVTYAVDLMANVDGGTFNARGVTPVQFDMCVPAGGVWGTGARG
jgi:hypothetical protein